MAKTNFTVTNFAGSNLPTSVEDLIQIVTDAVRSKNKDLGYYFNQEELQDIRQDLLMKVWITDTFDPSKASFKTWIARITRNYTCDYGKGKTKREVTEIHDFSEPDFTSSSVFDFNSTGLDIEAEYIYNEMYDWLNRQIADMSDRDRTIMEMTFQGYTRGEIAVELQCTKNAVSIARSRAYEKLREKAKRTFEA